MVKLAVGKFILDSLLETKVHDGAVVDDGLDRWERDESFLDQLLLMFWSVDIYTEYFELTHNGNLEAQTPTLLPL